MTAAEFKAAGLDKLSPEELARLNEWLRNKGVSPGAALALPPSEDRRGLPALDDGGPGEVVSRISGSFNGWHGKSVFHLENGQVWRVTDANANFSIKRLENPVVRIKRGILDAWYLSIDGYNRVVQVKRVE